MRILFVAPYLPSLIRVRPYNFIRGLAEQGHDIVLVALSESEEPGIQSLRQWCERIEIFPLHRISAYASSLLSMFGEGSLQAAYCKSPETSERVAEILRNEKFDLIHVDHLRAGQFVPDDAPCLKVIDAVDCITSLYEQFRRRLPLGPGRMKCQIEWKRLRRYEPAQLNRFDKVVVTCEREEHALREIGVRVPVHVVENGVDLAYFNNEAERCLSGVPTIVFSGKMSYAANAEAALFFAREVFPLIRQQAPEARFIIAGSYPGRKIRSLDSQPGIEVTGNVDDLREYLNGAHVSVSPMRIAVGIQNKVLEAMALGIPVVASSKACEGIKAEAGREILCADRAEDFAGAVLQILKDRDLAQKLSKNGRDYVQRHHQWKDKVSALELVYESGIGTSYGRTGILTGAA